MNSNTNTNSSDGLILQFNAHKMYEATDEVFRLAKKYNSDIILLQEPHYRASGGKKLVPQNGYNQIGDGEVVTLVEKRNKLYH